MASNLAASHENIMLKLCELENPTIVSDLRQLLTAYILDVVFLSKTKLHAYEFDRIRVRCNMDGFYVVDLVGRKGGLGMLWKDRCDLRVQSHSANNVDVLLNERGLDPIRFTGFYGYPDLTQRYLS